MVKKFVSLVTATVMAMSLTSALANDYTYEYRNFIANVVVPQSGLCDTAKSYAGHENEITASEYFSGLISAFRVDLDADSDMELVLVGDNVVSVYKIVEGAPKFAASYLATLVCDYGESFANVFVKNHNGRDYLCVETFEDTGSEKSYKLKMMTLDDDKLKLENVCSVEKTYKDDYVKEAASLQLEDRTTAYSSITANGATTVVNKDNYSDLYDAVWQMLNAMGFERPSFINSVNRLILDQTDADMHFEITNATSDVTLKSYVRASGIRTSQKPIVYFSDRSELDTLNVAPEATPEPTPIVVEETPEPVNPVDTPSETVTPQPTQTPVVTGVTVTIDGKEVDFSDQGACIVNDRTLVPMRVIFEELGANVRWLHEFRVVAATKSMTDIYMQIDNPVYYVNDEQKALDVAPMIINSRTMIPGRAVAESLGCTVTWDQDTRTVIIKTKNYVEPTPTVTPVPEPEQVTEQIPDAEIGPVVTSEPVEE